MEDKKINNPEELSKNTENNEEKLSAADLILQRLGKSKQKKEVVETVSEKKEEIKETVADKKEEIVEKVITEKKEVVAEVIEEKKEAVAEIIEEKTEEKATEISNEVKEEKEVKKEELVVEKPVQVAEEDYSKYTKEEIILKTKELIAENPVQNLKKVIYKIKGEFFSKLKAERAEKQEKFIADGGEAKDFKFEDQTEAEFKEVIKDYDEKKAKFEEEQSKIKSANLEKKLAVIAGIKELINKPEVFRETFNQFKKLQEDWRGIGLIAKDKVKEVWDEYNLQVEKFYNYVKINNELRDLDFKKNLTAKIKLCEKSEELLLEENISKAQKKLQELHASWKEIGPIAKEKKDEIWERFKSATVKINTKFQEYIDKIREKEQENLKSKTFLCEKVEEYVAAEKKTHKDWKNASNKIIQIQQLWREVGYVPKEHNTEIYQRFRNACDKFFEQIRVFYAEANEEKEKNLQLKNELCLQAESMQESTDWRKTTELYKNIQANWKKIGPVPQKVSDEIWTRFRKACNTFFDKKKEFFTSRTQSEQENLAKKQELIEKIANFEGTGTSEENLDALKQFQKEWTEIGFVPFDKKDDIYHAYREAIDNQFDKLKIDRSRMAEEKFNEKIENLKNSQNSQYAIDMEISKLREKVENIRKDIGTWENNLGFFSNSKNADSMLKDFKNKIEKSKEQIKKFEEQIKKLRTATDE